MKYDDYTIDFDSSLIELDMSEYARNLKFYFCAINNDTKVVRNISGPFMCREYGARYHHFLNTGLSKDRYDLIDRVHQDEDATSALLLQMCSRS